MGTRLYRGRFAPSPTGPLHAGSLVAALASWLDARAHNGRWLVRIEDVDTPRCVPGADQTILEQLAACGLVPDETPVYQSQRSALYQQAMDQLVARGLAYPCGCTRQDIARALAAAGQLRQRHGELVYPGTCRQGLQGRAVRAWRFLTDISKQNRATAHAEWAQPAIKSVADQAAAAADADAEVMWHDRLLGPQAQNVSREVGDFVLKRADGFWAYQLAVVVDDAAQGVTDIVRGQDLADNTARQILLQRALGACWAWDVESENWPQRGQFLPDLQSHSQPMGQKAGEKWTAAADLQPTLPKSDRLPSLPVPRYLHTPLVLGANGEKLSKQNGAQPLDTGQPLALLQQAGRVLGLDLESHINAGTPADWLQQAVPLWAVRYVNVAH
ncbi:MAG: tRNA glutamyl-Q(34) synthetase GluQRS [Polaromonas sp.]